MLPAEERNKPIKQQIAGVSQDAALLSAAICMHNTLCCCCLCSPVCAHMLRRCFLLPSPAQVQPGVSQCSVCHHRLYAQCVSKSLHRLGSVSVLIPQRPGVQLAHRAHLSQCQSPSLRTQHGCKLTVINQVGLSWPLRAVTNWLTCSISNDSCMVSPWFSKFVIANKRETPKS